MVVKPGLPEELWLLSPSADSSVVVVVMPPFVLGHLANWAMLEFQADYPHLMVVAAVLASCRHPLVLHVAVAVTLMVAAYPLGWSDQEDVVCHQVVVAVAANNQVVA
jgi:hypothetical protein